MKAFVESIRTGKLLNNAEPAVESDLDGDSRTNGGVSPGDGDLGRDDGLR